MPKLRPGLPALAEEGRDRRLLRRLVPRSRLHRSPSPLRLGQARQLRRHRVYPQCLHVRCRPGCQVRKEWPNLQVCRRSPPPPWVLPECPLALQVLLECHHLRSARLVRKRHPRGCLPVPLLRPECQPPRPRLPGRRASLRVLPVLPRWGHLR